MKTFIFFLLSFFNIIFLLQGQIIPKYFHKNRNIQILLKQDWQNKKNGIDNAIKLYLKNIKPKIDNSILIKLHGVTTIKEFEKLETSFSYPLTFLNSLKIIGNKSTFYHWNPIGAEFYITQLLFEKKVVAEIITQTIAGRTTVHQANHCNCGFMRFCDPVYVPKPNDDGTRSMSSTKLPPSIGIFVINNIENTNILYSFLDENKKQRWIKQQEFTDFNNIQNKSFSFSELKEKLISKELYKMPIQIEVPFDREGIDERIRN